MYLKTYAFHPTHQTFALLCGICIYIALYLHLYIQLNVTVLRRVVFRFWPWCSGTAWGRPWTETHTDPCAGTLAAGSSSTPGTDCCYWEGTWRWVPGPGNTGTEGRGSTNTRTYIMYNITAFFHNKSVNKISDLIFNIKPIYLHNIRLDPFIKKNKHKLVIIIKRTGNKQLHFNSPPDK